MEKFKEICKNMFKAFLKVEYKLLLTWCTILTLWLFFTMMSMHIYTSVCDTQEKQIDSLKNQIEKLEYPELQKSISTYYESKGVRLDVYVKDSDKVFDIEIQNGKKLNVNVKNVDINFVY